MTVAAATLEIPAPGEVRSRPYRVAELAERWDIDVPTVRRMIYAGALHAEGHGPRGGALRVRWMRLPSTSEPPPCQPRAAPPPPRRGSSVSMPIAMSAPGAAWVQGEGVGREPEP